MNQDHQRFNYVFIRMNRCLESHSFGNQNAKILFTSCLLKLTTIMFYSFPQSEQLWCLTSFVGYSLEREGAIFKKMFVFSLQKFSQFRYPPFCLLPKCTIAARLCHMEKVCLIVVCSYCCMPLLNLLLTGQTLLLKLVQHFCTSTLIRQFITLLTFSHIQFSSLGGL